MYDFFLITCASISLMRLRKGSAPGAGETKGLVDDAANGMERVGGVSGEDLKFQT